MSFFCFSVPRKFLYTLYYSLTGAVACLKHGHTLIKKYFIAKNCYHLSLG